LKKSLVKDAKEKKSERFAWGDLDDDISKWKLSATLKEVQATECPPLDLEWIQEDLAISTLAFD
jgi:hypothetical protein